MKILVCIKQVPATNDVSVDEKTGVLLRDGAQSKTNPYDLYALEMALRLREQYGGSVHALSMGPLQAKQTLLEAMCIGADGATLLSDRRFAGADVLATARVLAAGVRRLGDFDLILCGKQTTDGDTAQAGPEMAELLGIEHASCVRSLQVEQESVVVELALDDGVLVQKMPFPCLVTVEKDINTPRLPSYLRSLSAKESDIQHLMLEDLHDVSEKTVGLSGSPTQVERIFLPDARQERSQYCGNAQELAEVMHEILRKGKFIAPGGMYGATHR